MATRFYQELFRRNSSLRPLFSTGLDQQEAKFAGKLTEIVRAIAPPRRTSTHTRTLGARHVGYGVRAADYQTLGNALLAALAAVLGDSFDPLTREAWTFAYNLIAETMLEGAAAARAIDS
jgi:hemoglobin-like flavoprotein